MRRLRVYLFVFSLFSIHAAFSQKLQHDWENYVTAIKDKPVSINVDLGIKPFVPLKDMPHVMIVRLKLQASNEFGMPSEDEVLTLNEIEEQLAEEMTTILDEMELDIINRSLVRMIDRFQDLHRS